MRELFGPVEVGPGKQPPQGSGPSGTLGVEVAQLPLLVPVPNFTPLEPLAVLSAIIFAAALSVPVSGSKLTVDVAACELTSRYVPRQPNTKTANNKGAERLTFCCHTVAKVFLKFFMCLFFGFARIPLIHRLYHHYKP